MSKKKIIVVLVIALLLTAGTTALGVYGYNASMAQRTIDGYIEAGDTAFAAGEYTKALDYYNLVPEGNKRFEEAQEKISQVQAAITADIESQIDSYFQAGDKALAVGDFATALKYYNLVPADNARFAEAQTRIAALMRAQIDSYFQAGDKALAAGDFATALTYYNLVPADNARFAEAQARITAVMSAQIDSYFKAGDAALEAGDFAAALTYYDKVPATDERYEEAQARKALVEGKKIALVKSLIQDADRFMEKGQFDKAEAALNEAEGVYPAYKEIAAARTRLKVARLVDSAAKNYEAKSFEQALKDIEAAIAIDRTVETRYRTLLGNIRYEEATGRAVRLIETLQKAGVPVGDYVILTEQTDPDGLLGKPDGYIAKISFADTTIPQLRTTAELRGGAIEVFLTPKDAEARLAGIQGPTGVSPIAAEYAFVNGSVLLRLSSLLTAEQIAVYEELFMK